MLRTSATTNYLTLYGHQSRRVHFVPVYPCYISPVSVLLGCTEIMERYRSSTQLQLHCQTLALSQLDSQSMMKVITLVITLKKSNHY